MKDIIRKGSLVLTVVSLSACNSLMDNKYQLKGPLFNNTEALVNSNSEVAQSTEKKKTDQGPAFRVIKSLAQQFGVDNERPKVAATFSDSEMVRFTVDQMKLNEFIHHVFGGVLGVNYVVNEKLTALVTPVTLNFQQPLSKKQAFLAASEVLTQKQVGVSVKQGTYYLYPMEADTQSVVSIGVGRETSDLPLVGNQVLQIFPMNYGVTIGIERTLRQLADISITVDMDQSAVYLQGERNKVRKVMELARILDLPSNKGKHIGLMKLTYISTTEFTKQVSQLLESEGIPAAVGSGKQKNLALVPINQIGLVAVFSSNPQFLQRVKFWQEQLDKPSEGTEKRYFWYEPINARARDLGESLTPLFGGTATGGTQAAGNSSRDTRSALASGAKASKSQGAPSVVKNADMSMVVDERTNTLVFHTSGKQYQKLLPLIERMDTLPRQVILEATVAEVTLTDGFKYGVEYALKNGSFGYGGALLDGATGGFGASWAGVVAGESAAINLVKSSNLINVLSNPTLLVRDGVSASIVVGEEVPLTSSTTSNPLGGTTAQSTTIERRQTGLTLNVTPTINSQGIIIMEIMLQMVNNSSGEVLLNRQVNTEVVANSGQTVILAGLVSENGSDDGNKIPLLGDVPVLGHLFKNKTQSNIKTELVILVTPKIINDGNQWGDIKNKFRKGLENIEF